MRTPFYDRFMALIASRYPKSELGFPGGIASRLSATLFSEHVLHLPQALSLQAENVVRAFFNLRQSTQWRERLENVEPRIPDPRNFSVLMSYDFHVDTSGNLRLIEINTNASMSLFADLLHEIHETANPFSKNFRTEIIDDFLIEHRLACGGDAKSAIITDQDPQTQRLYAEFVMYQELLQNAGLNTAIADSKDIQFIDGRLIFSGANYDLVYNRNTDFYFEDDSTKSLRAAMLNGAGCITPNPFEYRLLADKERLLEISAEGALESFDLSRGDCEAIKRALIRTRDVLNFASAEELWAERKKWFFKPKRSYGGKAVYRGASITRSTFAQIFSQPTLAQEYVPPATASLGGVDFKYDLRFYAYRNRVQLACARVYQGQTTNSQTPGGGLALINWT